MERREGRVEFLGEQSGSVEDLLKRDLIFEFATRPDIRRVYLARVGFQPDAETSAAVWHRLATPDDRSLVIRVGDIFRRRFGKDAVLDVLFLTAEQEMDIARVCRPFYSAPE